MSAFALQLAGAVALLLWSIGLVRAGVERAFMSELRSTLRRSAQFLPLALLSGCLTAVFLQSSTAVGVLAAGFAEAGVLTVSVGLVLLLGADVGSAIVAKILLAPVSWIIPVLLLAGVAMFGRASSTQVKQFGRILIGLALIFLAIGIIRSTAAPLQDYPETAAVVGFLAADPWASFALGAILAYLMHSSIAAVLFFITLLIEGLLVPNLTIALVLGANFGGAIIPVVLKIAAPAPARQIVFSNLLLRGGGAAGLLLYSLFQPVDLAMLGTEPAQQVIHLHILFNLVLAVVALPLVRPVIWLIKRTVAPDAPSTANSRLSALDQQALSQPDQALACAAREMLRMGESVHAMLVPSYDLLKKMDEQIVDVINENEDVVDAMHFEIKLYIARLQESVLSPKQAKQAMNLVTIANSLEDAADQISTNLLEIAQRLHDSGLSFSESGWQDLADFHDRVVSNSQLALNILITADPDYARQLVAEKDRTRQAEKELQERHLMRLRGGNSASIETSNLHQETIRAYKQINSDLSYVAYPIAEETGDLLSSRLAHTSSQAK